MQVDTVRGTREGDIMDNGGLRNLESDKIMNQREIWTKVADLCFNSTLAWAEAKFMWSAKMHERWCDGTRNKFRMRGDHLPCQHDSVAWISSHGRLGGSVAFPAPSLAAISAKLLSSAEPNSDVEITDLEAIAASFINCSATEKEVRFCLCVKVRRRVWIGLQPIGETRP